MNFNKFVGQIEEVRQQTYSLQQRITRLPHREDLLMQTFEQLNASLEELHVAEEELLQQNEELFIAQQKLQKQSQRYQELFDFAPDGYLITDVNCKILEANRVASQLLAIDKNLVIGKLLIIFVPQEARREFRNKISCLRKQTQLKDWEINLKNYQGSLFDCEISASTINDSQDNCIGIRWMLRDISTRKQAEAKIRLMELQNYQLQEASRIKSKILAVLSHELRTPLNAVLGFSDLLLRLNRNLFNPQSINIVETIIRNGKQLLALINDMLDFAKLEQGEIILKTQEFNIEELTNTVVEDLRFFANRKKLSIETCIDIQNVRIINDPIRVKQILANLISNAIKFTKTGKVSIQLQELNEDKIIIIVKDTGIGISEIDLQCIFQAFRQVNQTINRTSQGTGLGLAIVKHLLDLMGGSITVESIVGEGSIFRVELPRTVNNEQ